MAWFDPLEWGPPATWATSHTPVMLWTDAQTFALFWTSGNNICRNDFLVDPDAGTITDTGFHSFATDDVSSSQYLTHASLSPSGAVIFEIAEETSG